MAKKKGKREEGFTFPEFDKEEFRQKELKDSKVILFAVFYAFTMAVISYYLVRMTSLERSVMIFGFIAPFGLIKILPLLFDTSDFERKNWFGPMFMSFLAWLGLFILFSNPPFNDISNPEFGVNEIYVEEDGNWNLTTEINSGEPFIFIVSEPNFCQKFSTMARFSLSILKASTIIVFLLLKRSSLEASKPELFDPAIG